MRAAKPSNAQHLEPAPRGATRDALGLLREQHGQLGALFEQLDDAAPEYRKALVDELAAVLIAHATIETELFYPALSGTAEAAVLAATEELAMIGQCLAKLLQVKTTDRTFAAKVSVLEDMVRRHLELSERDIFGEAQRERGDVLMTLGARMAERFQEIRSAGHLDLVPERGMLHADPASAVPAEPEIRVPSRSGIRPSPFGRSYRVTRPRPSR